MSTSESFLIASDAFPINIFKGGDTWKNVVGLQDKATKACKKWMLVLKWLESTALRCNSFRTFLTHIFSSGQKIWKGCIYITKATWYEIANQKRSIFLFNKGTCISCKYLISNSQHTSETEDEVIRINSDPSVNYPFIKK